jgi:hypothetical protein
MTRCFNCGAERDSDQCLSCGLTSAAAEVVFRRRLVRRTAWFLVGTVMFLPVSQAFPPLELDRILIFLGALFFALFCLGLWMVNRARRRQEIEAIKHIYFGLLPVPWILAALLFINGRLDNGRAHRETGRVVSKLSMTGLLRPQRLIVTSWRQDHTVERLSVGGDDYGRFQVGDSVVSEIKDGVMGIPWVFAVYRP